MEAATITIPPPPRSKRPRTEVNVGAHRIPTYDLALLTESADDLLQVYRVHQAIHFQGTLHQTDHHDKHVNSKDKHQLSWTDMGSIYQSLNSCDQESWCVENQGTVASKEDDLLKPAAFLDPQTGSSNSAYCSF